MSGLPATNRSIPGAVVYGQGSGLQGSVVSQAKLVRQQLQSVGASRVAMRSMEGRYLPSIIHPDESIQGVVYGQTEYDGLGMLVATDRRAIFLDKSLFSEIEDEISYKIVNGISYSHAGVGSTVTMHTPIKDYTIRTLNEKSAKVFVGAIENRCIEQYI